MWQDWVIAIAQASFTVSLVPMLRSVLRKDSDPPHLFTAAGTALGLGAIAFAMVTLHLWWSALTGAATCGMWGWLAYLRWQANHAKPEEPSIDAAS